MATPAVPLLVDTHVHLHSGVTANEVLTAAWIHFGAAAASLGIEGDCLGALLLTESAGVQRFRQLRDAADPDDLGLWTVQPTDEPESLLAEGPGDARIILVAGRQIVAAEDLEVLALGRDLDEADGAPLRELLARVVDTGAAAVVPWGFGKWWGARGRRVQGLIDDPPARPFLLGDNGGRLEWLPRPALFGVAEAAGIAVVPGSDPLPLPDEMLRGGSRGLLIDGGADIDPVERRPAALVRERLRELSPGFRSFGHGAGLLAFLRAQVAMQRRKRSR